MRTIYLVKDLSQATGLSVYTIKYYLNLGMITEFGRSPGTKFRYFDKTAINKLLLIREYRKEGKSLRQIKSIINKPKANQL